MISSCSDLSVLPSLTKIISHEQGSLESTLRTRLRRVRMLSSSLKTGIIKDNSGAEELMVKGVVLSGCRENFGSESI